MVLCCVSSSLLYSFTGWSEIPDIVAVITQFGEFFIENPSVSITAILNLVGSVFLPEGYHFMAEKDTRRYIQIPDVIKFKAPYSGWTLQLSFCAQYL